jgi:hypothetical protein
MVRPWRRKNCGRKITKPKINVLMVTSAQLPTRRRCSSGGASRASALTGFAARVGAGVGSGPAVAASFSIAFIRASASSVRPFDSSQRGDSGKALRRYQTMSEPMPAITNIGRQPQVGMIKKARSEVAGKPATTSNAIKESHRPRDLGGTISVSVE